MTITLVGWFADYIRQSARAAGRREGKQPGRPDPDCKACNGSGWIETEDDGYAPCACTWSKLN
jgi:hypothetical protein